MGHGGSVLGGPLANPTRSQRAVCVCPAEPLLLLFLPLSCQVDIEVEILSDSGGEYRYHGPRLKVRHGRRRKAVHCELGVPVVARFTISVPQVVGTLLVQLRGAEVVCASFFVSSPRKSFTSGQDAGNPLSRAPA